MGQSVVGFWASQRSRASRHSFVCNSLVASLLPLVPDIVLYTVEEYVLSSRYKPFSRVQHMYHSNRCFLARVTDNRV